MMDVSMAWGASAMRGMACASQSGMLASVSHGEKIHARLAAVQDFVNWYLGFWDLGPGTSPIGSRPRFCAFCRYW